MYVDTITILHNRFPRRESYPFNVPALTGSDRLDLRNRAAFLVGDNGSGKSTLLEAIARNYGLTVWGGEKSHIAHRNPFSKSLHHFLSMKGTWEWDSIVKGFFFRAESFFNFAAFIDDMSVTDRNLLDYYGGRSLHQQSHGEAFLAFFEYRCRLPGLYLLDEPEAALSPRNQLHFIFMLHRALARPATQFIIATHSPILLSYPKAQILSCDHVPIKEIDYHETKSYCFYKDFLQDPLPFLKDFE